MESGILVVIILIFSAILLEIAHGFFADHLGDPTARLAGRLTLNPQKHIDLFLPVVLPFMTYVSSGGTLILGGAKPVPIDPFNLKEGRKDLALVSLAGPLTNVMIAVIFSVLIRILNLNPTLLSFSVLPILASIVKINLVLAIFNLLPIPPLDGSKVFSLLLSEKDANTYMSLSSFGFFILFFLLLFPLGGFSLTGFIFNVLNFAQNLLLP